MSKKKIKWTPIVKRKIVPITNIIAIGYAEVMEEKIGVKFSNVLVIPKGGINILHFDLDQLKNLGMQTAGKLREDPAFATKVTKECERACESIVETAKKAVSGGLEKLPNSDLLERLESYVGIHHQLAPFMSIPHSVEQVLPKKIEEGLKRTLPGEKASELLPLLTAPDEWSFATQEHVDLLKLAIRIKREKLAKAGYKEELASHAQRYLWLSIWNLSDPILEGLYFEKQLKELLAHDLKQLENELEEIKRGRSLSEETLEELSIKGELREKIKLMRRYVFLRNYRREMLALSYFHVRPLLEEIAKRAGLNLNGLCHLLHPEIIEFLQTGKLPPKEEISARKKQWAFVMKEGEWKLLSDKEAIKRVIKEELGEEAIVEVAEIKGNVACRGKVRGKVRVIMDKAEMGKFKKGEVLVTTMTTPDFVVIMKQAAAVVTDEGGLTCHAAIISRELSIPCVIGTEKATEVFKDGDLVEVDAVKGTVKIIKKG